MTTYDRNRNAITTGSRVMISDTGLTGRVLWLAAPVTLARSCRLILKV